MLKHEYFEYLASYALDALSPAERARVEEHLRDGCDLCEPELRALNATVERIPYGLPPVKLPTGLKGRIQQRLEQEGMFKAPIAVVQKKSPVVNWLAAAAVLAAALAAGLYWNTQAQLKEQSEKLAEREAHLLKMEQTLKIKDAEISWLRDPGVQLALLTGLAEASQARGRMIWHPVEHKGIFYVESLPPLVSNKSYQLWVIGAKGPVSAGVFAPDRRGAAVVTISRLEGSLEQPQFAVTIEPYGGVEKPTSNPILLGKPL